MPIAEPSQRRTTKKHTAASCTFLGQKTGRDEGSSLLIPTSTGVPRIEDGTVAEPNRDDDDDVIERDQRNASPSSSSAATGPCLLLAGGILSEGGQQALSEAHQPSIDSSHVSAGGGVSTLLTLAAVSPLLPTFITVPSELPHTLITTIVTTTETDAIPSVKTTKTRKPRAKTLTVAAPVLLVDTTNAHTTTTERTETLDGDGTTSTLLVPSEPQPEESAVAVFPTMMKPKGVKPRKPRAVANLLPSPPQTLPGAAATDTADPSSTVLGGVHPPHGVPLPTGIPHASSAVLDGPCGGVHPPHGIPPHALLLSSTVPHVGGDEEHIIQSSSSVQCMVPEGEKEEEEEETSEGGGGVAHRVQQPYVPSSTTTIIQQGLAPPSQSKQSALTLSMEGMKHDGEGGDEEVSIEVEGGGAAAVVGVASMDISTTTTTTTDSTGGIMGSVPDPGGPHQFLLRDATSSSLSRPSTLQPLPPPPPPPPQQKQKKGLSMDDKVRRVEDFLREHPEPYTLKDLLALIPKAKGVVPQSIEECLEELVSESRVSSERIGISTYFWKFAPNNALKLEATLQAKEEKGEQLRQTLQKQLIQLEKLSQEKFGRHYVLPPHAQQLLNRLTSATTDSCGLPPLLGASEVISAHMLMVDTTPEPVAPHIAARGGAPPPPPPAPALNIQQRATLEEQRSKLELERKSLQSQLEKYADRDPERLKKLTEAINHATMEVNKWTDDLFLLEDFITSKGMQSMSRTEFRRVFSVPQDIDYI